MKDRCHHWYPFRTTSDPGHRCTRYDAHELHVGDYGQVWRDEDEQWWEENRKLQP